MVSYRVAVPSAVAGFLLGGVTVAAITTPTTATATTPHVAAAANCQTLTTIPIPQPKLRVLKKHATKLRSVEEQLVAKLEVVATHPETRQYAKESLKRIKLLQKQTTVLRREESTTTEEAAESFMDIVGVRDEQQQAETEEENRFDNEYGGYDDGDEGGDDCGTWDGPGDTSGCETPDSPPDEEEESDDPCQIDPESLECIETHFEEAYAKQQEYFEMLTSVLKTIHETHQSVIRKM